MRYAVMALGWWAGGFVLAHYVLKRMVASGPGGNCPSCPKCWIGSIVSIGFGVGYYLLLGFKGGFASPEYFVSVVIAAIVGAAVSLALCPLPI
jgi:hypothetical protein